MKQGWEVKKLGEVLKIQNGYAFNSKLFTIEKGTPLIRIRDIKNGIGTETNFNGPYDKKYEVKAGDFLIGMDGEFGCYEWKGDTALLNQRVCRLQEFSERIHSRFLFYGINKYLKAIEDVTAFATVKHISAKQIENIEIPLPPLPEQQRIVAILDEAFTAIAKAKANAEQNLKNAKELFESLLIKIFIDGINVKKWNLEKLEKYNKVVVGYVGPISNEYTNDENGILLLSTKNISDKGVSLQKLTRINQQFHIKNKKSQLLPGDILVARHGNSGQAAVIKENIKEAHALNVIIIKKSAILSSEYICFLLNSGVLEKITFSKAGSVQEIINTSIIKDLIIPVPSVAEQQSIVQKLEALSAKTKKLESIYQQKINDLEELKKSILQKAFSGELKTDRDIAA